MTETDRKKKILITGGSGFLGARLAARILADDPGAKIVLSDIAVGPRLDSLAGRIEFVQADIGDPAVCRNLIDSDVGTVYHLASLVSGGAEKDFEAGMRANVFATINLLEACRLRAERPVVVFTSSIATFGGTHLPEEVTDYTYQHPQNSYGVAKVVGEQLLNDYTRKGYVDGRGVRLAAIIVRDVANTALSGYASNMIREPLSGKDYVCPVGEDTRIPLMGIEKAAEFLYRLGRIDGGLLGDYRTVNGRGISPRAGEIAAAVAKKTPPGKPLGKITFRPDPEVEKIISTWPRIMRADRAVQAGLPGDASIVDIIEEYLATRGG